MIYRGDDHGGRIAEVKSDIQPVIECNCSICSKRDSLRWFAPREQLRLITSEADLTTYSFGKRTIKHHFRPDCGCAPLGTGSGTNRAVKAAVNVRAWKVSMSPL
jgi:hypothetical protein